MKIGKLFFSLALALIIVAPNLTLALDELSGVKIIKLDPDISGGIGGLVAKIAGFAAGLLFAIASLFILYAAYLYLTAAGDTEKLGKAKNIIIYAIVAIIVAFISQTIVTITRNVIGGGSAGSTSPSDHAIYDPETESFVPRN